MTPLTKGPGEGSGRQFFAAGEGIVDYLASKEFLDRGGRIVRWIVRGTDFINWEALFNDAYLKVRKSVDRPSFLQIEDEEGFYKVFFVLVLNLRNDRFRKARKERTLFAELPKGELTKADPSIDLESEQLMREFGEMIEKLPDQRRRAIELRRQGRTYREIAKILKTSHVTVRSWIKDALKTFLDS